MMKYDRVVFKENHKGITKYYVLGLEDRTFFDSLIKFLEKYYEAEIISKNEGLITRFWQLRIKEEGTIQSWQELIELLKNDERYQE